MHYPLLHGDALTHCAALIGAVWTTAIPRITPTKIAGHAKDITKFMPHQSLDSNLSVILAQPPESVHALNSIPASRYTKTEVYATQTQVIRSEEKINVRLWRLPRLILE